MQAGKKTELSRRGFLRASAITAAGLVAASCARPTPEVIDRPVTVVVEKEVPVEKQVIQTVVVEKEVPIEKVVQQTVVVEKEVEKVVKETVVVEKEKIIEKQITVEVEVAGPSQFREAPMLAELVAAGKLPPVEERLPLKPKVSNEMPPEQLAFQVGRYGGTLRTITPAAQWDTDVYVFCNEAILNTPGIEGIVVSGNIVDSFQVSDDQTEFTFHLREGIKWSDGTPVTTEDIRFAYDDVIMNTDLTVAPPNWLKSGNTAAGTPVVLKVMDDYTWSYTFDQAYGGFLLTLAISGWRNYADILKPAHFLKPYHADYATEAELDAAMKEANVETWPQLFGQVDQSQWDITRGPYFKGFPALTPWLLTDTGQEGQIFERNPYYFKVDTAGNQLPYIDYIDSRYVADAEVIQMKIVAGECDYGRSNPKMAYLPLYKENEERAGFTTYFAKFHATSIDLTLNMTHADEVWREVVRNVDFRRALNYAIDKDEIVDAVWQGFGTPSTTLPPEFDPEKARMLLDSIGMDKMSADGYRLGPDGEVFEIPFETGAQRVDMVPTLELIVQFWEDIGVRTTMKKIDGSLWTQRRDANELKATIYWTSANWYSPSLQQNHWAPLWNDWWNTGGTEGEEPPEEVKEAFGLLASVTVLPPDQGKKAYEQALQMNVDNVWLYMLTQNILQPMIVNTRLGNVSDSEDAWAIGVNFSAEQFYYKS